MANWNSSTKSYPSPLEPYTANGVQLTPLPTTRNADGKSLVNPPRQSPDSAKSTAYDRFEEPIANTDRGGWDIHVYYHLDNEDEVAYAKALHERVRREFPELRIYRLHDTPIGPHPIPMFEVNVFTPLEFGAFVAWLAVHRGPLGALIHPNTHDEVRDHTENALWFGERVTLDLSILKAVEA